MKSRHMWAYGLFNLTLLLLLALWLWQKNQAISIPDAILPADGKVACVSYAPYYEHHQTPLKIGTLISRKQIESDLKLIAQRSHCVRTYSVGQGLDVVPEIASSLGLKVILGAWVGWTDADNLKEIDLAVRVANQYPDAIKGIIIGNEVLLRGEQSEEVLQSYIVRAKQFTEIPVSYADVWEFWLNHRNLEQSVDFVTIHLLPYWENNPQSVNQAIQHANMVMTKAEQAFSKPILIGETGWPSNGRQRGASIPSPLHQAQYIREFLREADTHQWQYNLIEAFDQPWKRTLEGTVGGYWGIYDTKLAPKFNFVGAIKERSDQVTTLLFALVGMFTMVLTTYAVGIKRKSTLFNMAVLGIFTGLMSMLQIEYVSNACGGAEWLSPLYCVPNAGKPLSDPILVLEWFSLGGAILANWCITLCMPAWVYQRSRVIGIVIQCASIILLLGAVTIGLLLIADGRYRDFPVILYLLPALELSLGLLVARASLTLSPAIFITLSTAFLTTAASCYLIEPVNIQALYWLGIAILFMIPCFIQENSPHKHH